MRDLTVDVDGTREMVVAGCPADDVSSEGIGDLLGMFTPATAGGT
jgi:hypothetical protein